MLDGVINKASEDVDSGLEAAERLIGIDTTEEGGDTPTSPIQPAAQFKEMARRHIVDAANEQQEALT